MGRTVAELTNSISAYELHEWMAFYTIEAEDEADAIERAKRGASDPAGGGVDPGDDED